MAEEEDEDEGITIKVGGGSPVETGQAGQAGSGGALKAPKFTLGAPQASPSGAPPGAKELVLVSEPGPGSGGPAAPV